MLAQVSGNLGIAMRQKSQFMPFLFILYNIYLYGLLKESYIYNIKGNYGRKIH